VTRFWDTPAVIPLLVEEPMTNSMLALLREDEHMIVWWGTQVEVISALARRIREGGLDGAGYSQLRSALTALAGSWSEVQPSPAIRTVAERLVMVHPLRAGDALQLASALTWCESVPSQRTLICLDDRLREAAQKEGFTVQPGI
jgi:uncharacterized protein